MGIARNARADSPCAAETKTGLRQPEQASASALESVWRWVASAAASGGHLLHLGTAQRSRSVFGTPQSGISRGGNRRAGQIGSGNAKSLEDAEESQDQCAQGRLLLSRVGSAGGAGVYRNGDAEFEGAFQDSELSAEMAATAHGLAGRGTRGAGRRAWPKIRQGHRPVLRDAAARQGQDSRGPHQDPEKSCRHKRRAQKTGKSKKRKEGRQGSGGYDRREREGQSATGRAGKTGDWKITRAGGKTRAIRCRGHRGARSGQTR